VVANAAGGVSSAAASAGGLAGPWGFVEESKKGLAIDRFWKAAGVKRPSHSLRSVDRRIQDARFFDWQMALAG
jgi:hypothetical protein